MNPYVLPAILAAIGLLIIVIGLLVAVLHRLGRPQASIRPVPVPRRTRPADAATAIQPRHREFGGPVHPVAATSRRPAVTEYDEGRVRITPGYRTDGRQVR